MSSTQREIIIPPSPEVKYLIWSNRREAWWRPESKGYTRDPAEAGRYTEADALTICLEHGGGISLVRRSLTSRRNAEVPGQVMVPEFELQALPEGALP
jgi:hypothetical protein